MKILDFGLALLTEGSKLTQLDTTVGTIAYMSPEQTQGSGVDHRTDIWSLGVVLYEMVTGQKPFKGDYDKAVMYSILNEEPEPITALRTGVPMQLEDYVGKALAKEAEDRYQSAGDLLIDLRTMARPMNSRGSRTLLTAQPPSTPIDGRSAARTLKLPWMVAGLLAAALTLLAFVHFTEPVEQRPVRRFSFTPRSLLETDYMRAAISPDGRWIVYVSDEGPGSLWIRPIDSEGSYKLEGTDGAWLGPFWSPDNRYVGFASDGQLKKVAVAGETPLVVCELPAGSTWQGGTWSPDGETIVFSWGPGPVALFEVFARGGEARPLFEPVRGTQGIANQQPYFLPSDTAARGLMFTVGSGMSRDIYFRNLDTHQTVKVVEGARPVYSRTGHILFQRSPYGRGVWALPFSFEKLEPTGDAFLVAEGMGDHSLAADGSLVAVEVLGGGQQQLVWRDRAGARLGEIGRPQIKIDNPALSPDGRRVAVAGQEDEATSADIWLHEVGRAVTQRLTFHPSMEGSPAWSPDGERVAFRSGRSGAGDLFVRRADGTGNAEALVDTPESEADSDWSPDGSSLIYSARSPQTGKLDLHLIDFGGTGARRVLTETQFNERWAQISASGLAAYCSDESGANEVYVRELNARARRRQVSENGGCQPRWGPDGRELFYVEGDTLVAVEVAVDSEIEVGRAERLFSEPNLRGAAWTYDVAADSRLVTVEDVATESGPERDAAIHIVQNWYEEFRDRE